MPYGSCSRKAKTETTENYRKKGQLENQIINAELDDGDISTLIGGLKRTGTKT